MMQNYIFLKKLSKKDHNFAISVNIIKKKR
jgi:hypothetical protein